MNCIKNFKSYSELMTYMKKAISKRNIFLKYLAEEKEFIDRSFENERKKELMDSLITNPNSSRVDFKKRIRDIDNCEELVKNSFPVKYREYYESVEELDKEIDELTDTLYGIDALRTKSNREWIVIILKLLGNYALRSIEMNGNRILAFVKNGVKANNLTNEEYVMLSSSKDIIYYDNASMLDSDAGYYLETKKTLSCFFPLNDEINEVLFKEYLSSIDGKRKERK